MKNSANAAAPAGVCALAAAGMTGGFSPGRVLGPEVGTSEGTAPTEGVEDVIGDELVGGATLVDDGVENVGVVTRGVEGAVAPPEFEQAATNTATAANAPIPRIAR